MVQLHTLLLSKNIWIWIANLPSCHTHQNMTHPSVFMISDISSSTMMTYSTLLLGLCISFTVCAYFIFIFMKKNNKVTICWLLKIYLLVTQCIYSRHYLVITLFIIITYFLRYHSFIQCSSLPCSTLPPAPCSVLLCRAMLWTALHCTALHCSTVLCSILFYSLLHIVLSLLPISYLLSPFLFHDQFSASPSLVSIRPFSFHFSSIFHTVN